MAATLAWIALSYVAGGIATYAILAGRLMASRGADAGGASSDVRRWSDEVSDAIRK